MTRSTLPGENERLPIYPLRVFRIEPGTRSIIRMLSERYYGCFTHWHQKHSVYCPGQGCNPAIHRTEWFWKGYTAAEVYSQDRALWLPVCFEFTEAVELALRGIYARGHVWEFFRLPQTGRRKTPVSCCWLEERDPKTFPSAFDIVPCLKHLYHVEAIDLDVPNPLPPRTLVSPSKDAPPVAAVRSREEPSAITAEEREKVRELLQQRQGHNGRNGGAK